MDLEQMKMVVELVKDAKESAVYIIFAIVAKDFLLSLIGYVLIVVGISKVVGLMRWGISCGTGLDELRGAIRSETTQYLDDRAAWNRAIVMVHKQAAIEKAAKERE